MDVRLIDTEAGLEGLEAAWNALSDRLPPAFFSTYDYVRLAWKHFSRPDDRLLVLVLSDESGVQAIGPFCIVHRSRRGIRHRIVRFIAEWEGDRPGILSLCDPEVAWTHFIDFLTRSFRRWDVLELMEQAPDGPGGRGWDVLGRRGLLSRVEHDAVDYYISIDGSWDDYLRRLDGDTRRGWRRLQRRITEKHGPVRVERLSGSQDVDAGLDRYVAIERAGWKPSAGLGLAKDDRHLRFYTDLVRVAARRGRARVYILVVGTTDVAGYVGFVHRDVSFHRHTCYLPAFAEFSPGTLLHAEVFRDSFALGDREADLLSMAERGETPYHKARWATGRRETVRVAIVRRWGRLAPLIAVQRLFGRGRENGGVRAANAGEPAEAR